LPQIFGRHQRPEREQGGIGRVDAHAHRTHAFLAHHLQAEGRLDRVLVLVLERLIHDEDVLVALDDQQRLAKIDRALGQGEVGSSILPRRHHRKSSLIQYSRPALAQSWYPAISRTVRQHPAGAGAGWGQ
jgi:hypothetical protein